MSFAFSSYAQFNIIEHVERNPISREDIYRFPLLQGDNEICGKVNGYLINNILDLELASKKSSIFENVWETTERKNAIVNYLSYKVEQFDQIIYCITISGEGSGAYCESFERSFSFDLKTGNYFSLNTLLTTEGQEKLLDELNKNKTVSIQRKIARLKDRLLSPIISQDDKELYTEMLGLYRECNCDYDDLEHFRFIFSGNDINIIYGRCSAHYNRAIDDLGYFNKSISIDEWKAQLSNFGKDILINE